MSGRAVGSSGRHVQRGKDEESISSQACTLESTVLPQVAKDVERPKNADPRGGEGVLLCRNSSRLPSPRAQMVKTGGLPGATVRVGR